MNLLIEIHGYVSIILNDVPALLEKYLRDEIGLFIKPLGTQHPKNLIAVLNFVPDSEIPLWTDSISLGINGGYADPNRKLFWYVDKYGAAVCADLNSIDTGPFQFLVSENVVAPNFVEIIIRGWLLRFSLISRRVSFVHASAVRYDDKGILFSAWGGTGKTNLVLKLLEQGAGYLGDDLVLLTEFGELLAFPERINVFDYNLENNNFLKEVLPIKSRLLFQVKKTLKKSYQILGEKLPVASGVRAVFKRIVDFSYPLGALPVSVKNIFPDTNVVQRTKLTHVFFLFRSTGADVCVTEVPSIDDMTTRMAACLRYEHAYCDNLYDSFLFAFPEYRQNCIDELFDLQSDILTKGCQQARCWYVYVPITASAQSLYESLIPFLTL